MDIQSIMSQMGGGGNGPSGPPSMGVGGNAGMEGMPSEGSSQVPPLDNSPQQGILQKMSGVQKGVPSSESKKIQNIVIALKSLDLLANELEGQDPANTQAVRMMIRILGEILKSSQQDQQVANNINQPNIMGDMG